MDIQAKITKLLRLADQKDSAEEAAVAYAQAQRLATLHGFNLSDVALDDAETEADVPLVVEDIERMALDTWGKAVAWKGALASAIADANNCKLFYRHHAEGGVSLVLYGQPADMHVVTILYRSIGEQIDRLAKSAVRNRSVLHSSGNRTYGRSFRLGAVATIRRRLPKPDATVAKHRADVDKRRELAVIGDDTQALAVSTQALARVCAAEQHLAAVRKAVDDYEKKLGLKKGSGFSSADAGGYYDGRQAAKSVTIGSPAKGLKG